VPFDGTGAAWDSFVSRETLSSFSHLAAWHEIMAGIFGHECLYRVAVDDEGTWQGVLPLVRVKSRVFGHYLVSMPFLSHGGPIGSTAAQAELVRDAVWMARRSGVDLLELRARHRLPSDLRVSERKITVMLELPDCAEYLWNEGFRAKLRSQIKRPLREGMQVSFGRDQLRPFYEVYTRNMRELGTPVLPRAFFERVAGLLADKVVFCTVNWGGQPVAAGCGFVWRDQFEISWAASLSEYNRYAPNMLLYWSLMERMIQRGVRVFNFGRCTPGGGTHRFKLQWGGVDVPLPWAQWSPTGLSAPPSQDSPRYRLATRLWQRTPLPVTNRLGPVVARYLP
jgi:serine/alanine adding enzyme